MPAAPAAPPVTSPAPAAAPAAPAAPAPAAPSGLPKLPKSPNMEGSNAPGARQAFAADAKAMLDKANAAKPTPKTDRDPPQPAPSALAEPAKAPEATKAPDAPAAAPAKAPEAPKQPVQNREEDPDPSQPIETQGPWKQKKHYQKLATTLETENTKLKEKIAKMSDAGVLQKRAETLEQRNAELEKIIEENDFVNSPKFKTDYFEPYAAEWKAGESDMSELTVTDAEGNTRPGTRADLAKIVALPLGPAIDLAEELFGKAASTVINRRNSIKALYDKQQRALEEKSREGLEKKSERQQKLQSIRQSNSQQWQEFNAEAVEKYDYLREKEGDQEWNDKLKTAVDLVDQSWTKDVNDPAMPDAEREDILRKRSAVRGRAIGFSLIKVENKRLKAEVAKLNEVIAGYKGAQPSNGDGSSATQEGGTPGAGMSLRDRIHQDAINIARGPRR